MGKVKIYTVSDGKLYEAEARETKKLYIIDDNSETWRFGYKTNLLKEGCHLTALEAVESKIKSKKVSLEYAKKRTHSINSELGQLKKLKKELTNPYNRRRCMSDIKDIRDIHSNKPHKTSEVMCVCCWSRWIAVRPVTIKLINLECSNCGYGYVIETGE